MVSNPPLACASWLTAKQEKETAETTKAIMRRMRVIRCVLLDMVTGCMAVLAAIQRVGQMREDEG